MKLFDRNPWFESVAVAQRRAQKRLPKSVYSALIAGSEAGVTLADNLAAFCELGFAPHVGDLPAARDMTTTVMGQTISLPVLISPTGVQSVHPDGEIAVARAAAARGTAIGLSSFASKPVEEVVQANPQTFFQIYWCGSREQIAGAARARPRRRRRRHDRHARLDVLAQPRLGQPVDPRPDRPQGDAAARARGPRPARRGSLDWARAGGPPDLSVPNLTPPGEPPLRSSARTASGCRPRPRPGRTCAGFASNGPGPFMLKGITRVDDARRAVDAGYTAISVSNHGGNNLDTHPRVDPRPPRGRAKPSAIRSRSCSTAASGAAATSSKRSRSAPER